MTSVIYQPSFSGSVHISFPLCRLKAKLLVIYNQTIYRPISRQPRTRVCSL